MEMKEKIGAELGLRLPKKGRQFFKDKKIKFLSKEPRGGFGTQIEKAKYSIQSFFEKYKIALNISKLFTFKEASLDVVLHLMSDKMDGIERGLYVVSES